MVPTYFEPFFRLSAQLRGEKTQEQETQLPTKGS